MAILLLSKEDLATLNQKLETSNRELSNYA